MKVPGPSFGHLTSAGITGTKKKDLGDFLRRHGLAVSVTYKGMSHICNISFIPNGAHFSTCMEAT